MLNLFSFWIKLLFSPHLIISFIYWISYSVLTNNDIEQNSLNRVYWTFLNSCAPLLLLILDHVYCSSCSIERMMLLFNVCAKKKINFSMSLAHSEVDRVDFFLTKRGMHRRKCSLSIIALLGFLQMPLRSHVGSLVTITQWKTFFLDLYCYKHQMLLSVGAHFWGEEDTFIPFQLVLPGMNVAVGFHLKYSAASPAWLMFFKEIIGLKIVCINNSKRFVLSVPGCSNILLLFSVSFRNPWSWLAARLKMKEKPTFCGALHEVLCVGEFSTRSLEAVVITFTSLWMWYVLSIFQAASNFWNLHVILKLVLKKYFVRWKHLC